MTNGIPKQVSPFLDWYTADMELCLPLMKAGDLNLILAQVAARVNEKMGKGPTPQTFYDLEHLQVADYTAFAGVADEQRQHIGGLYARYPIRPEDMIYLGLRSMFQFSWPWPTSEEDIRFAAAHDHVLNWVLTHKTLEIVADFTDSGALLPYWGRLAFLRVMTELPAENVSRFGLDRVACTLLKGATFNATAISLKSSSVIGINYALEPILKHLNRFLLHYFCTKDMSGPLRLSRAWQGIAPTVRYFWSDVASPMLTRSSTVLYEEEMALRAHAMTTDQVDFIVMHELGHIAFDHPRRVQEQRAAGKDVIEIQYEFEFAADAFALGLVRSKMIKNMRAQIDLGTIAEVDPAESVGSSLRSYQASLGAVYLLFTYMDFIQRAGELLRDRLGDRIDIRTRMDSHPAASARLDRLELTNVAEHLYTSPLERYARDFFLSVLDYAAKLDDEALVASLN